MLLLLACATSPTPYVPLIDAPMGTVEGVTTGILADDVLHTIDIRLNDGGFDALIVAPLEWVQADVEIDGEIISDVGIRLRGKIGSFRPIDQKPKFKIDFNRYVDGQRFEDLEALALNNEVVDCSYLKEPLGYSVFRAAGVPAPRTSFTTVTVDGEPYGLYVVVEFPDDRFLSRWYAEHSGNLYDGKYIWDGGNGGELVDFTSQLEDNFRLEEGEDVGLSDVYAITDALEGPFSEVEGLIDGDALRRFTFAEQWTGHIDGYAMNENNYRVYFNPEDGGANWIPWDLDYAFLDALSWGKLWNRPVGVVVAGCWDDEDCTAASRDAVREGLAALDVEQLHADLDRWAELTETAAEDDPRRECSRGSIDDWREDLRVWIDERGAWMEKKWGLDE